MYYRSYATISFYIIRSFVVWCGIVPMGIAQNCLLKSVIYATCKGIQA